MVETLQHNKIAPGWDNIDGLVNIETIQAHEEYFKPVDDLGKWVDGTDVLRGDQRAQAQGGKSTAWVHSGGITVWQWLYIFQTILRGRRSNRVTIQTLRYDPDRYVIANATLSLPPAPQHNKINTYYSPFRWSYTDVTVIEEQRMYGAIYTKDGAAQQADITTTPVLLTGFAANGESSGVTVSYTADSLTVGYGGMWIFGFSINGTKTASQIYKFNIRVNAVEGVYQCQLASDALTSGHTSMGGPLDLNANDVLTIYVETDDATAGTHLTPVDMSFWVTSVALDT